MTDAPVNDEDIKRARLIMARTAVGYMASDREMRPMEAVAQAFAKELANLRRDAEAMRSALELTDRYFMACALAWAANDGQLMDKDGRPMANAPDLYELCEEAAQAVAAIIRPGMKP